MRHLGKWQAGVPLIILAVEVVAPGVALTAVAPVAAQAPREPSPPAEAQAPAGGAASPLTAVESAAPADLAALLREAVGNHPAIRAAAARLEAARRVPSQVESPPDPVASVGYTNDGLSSFTLGDREFSMLSLTWSQDVPYPGKRRAAAEVAVRDAERSGEDLERMRLEVVAAIKSAFAEVYRLDRVAGILDETRAVLESLAETARRRYEAGEGVQESLLKARTVILKLDAERVRVAQDRRAAAARLNAAAGRAAEEPVGAALALPEASLPGDVDAWIEAAVASSPEVGTVEAFVRRGEASLRLARLDLKPDLLWSTTYSYRGELDPMVAGTFGLRLPTHRDRRQAQAVAQAEAELEAARRDLEDRQLRLRAEARDQVARVERAERLQALLAQGVIPQARMTLESARASYAVGRLGFLDLLGDLTAVLEARSDQATQEAERFRALAALEPLLGREVIRVEGGRP